MAEKERMLKWFGTPPDVEELIDKETRAKLLVLVDSYEALAVLIVKSVPVGPERTVALRKLMESRDALMRAFLEPFIN